MTIHPQDATTRGIVDGDTVRVWNHRGQVLAGAVVTDGIRHGVICIHEGAWPDPEPTAGGICKNGAVNVLTKDLPSSRLGTVVRATPRWSGLRNIPARRYRLRRLIRLPTHNPWGGRYPPAVRYLQYENQAHGRSLRRIDFSGKPQGSAEENVAGHIPEALCQCPVLTRRGRQTAPDKTGFQYADEAFQLSIFLPYPVCAAGK